MNILVIPTTDWIYHPFPNRLNHIFDNIGKDDTVYYLHFVYEKFLSNKPRKTNCHAVSAGFAGDDISKYYISNYGDHKRLIKKAIYMCNIDVILSANILPSYAATGFEVPIVYDYLDVMDEAAAAYMQPGKKRDFAQWVVKKITRHNIKNAREVITVTDELAKRHVVGMYGKDPNHVHVISNGVDLDSFKPGDKCVGRRLCGVENNLPIVGYVGSIENWVDLELAIKALKRINTNLVIIGSSLHTNRKEELGEFARSCGVFERVKFIESVPYEELPNYISGFDVGINPLKPSEHNTFSAGGKVFNYMACGVPVVSSPITPREDIRKHLKMYGSINDYIWLVENEILCCGTRIELTDAVKPYDWKELAKEYRDVLCKAIP